MNPAIDESDFPEGVASLVALFLKNLDFYRSSDFKEATLRTEFLNPMLESLGWDVTNRNGQSPLDREVVEELSMKIDGVSRAPDYGFLIGGQRKWFLEAKKPNVRLQAGTAAADAAFQLRRYSWSAGLSVGVLTNFYEFGIYDTRQVPTKGDSATVGRVAYFTADELPANWKLIWELFSRAAVVEGALEKFDRESSASKGTRTVDAEFLVEIKDWRLALAQDLARNNPWLDQDSLSLAVQRLLDRIIFLRFAEARGLEHFGELQNLATKVGVYPKLWTIFNRADDKYNSGLFYKSELSAAGEISDSEPLLVVSDEILSRILSRLYFPYPYEFSVIPGDILGNVYEQFLGDEIKLTTDRKVTVEQKLEVRKAGGVYYTPQPVVEFIIAQTINPLLEEKSPEAISKLRFLDPASGSGTFLISLFQNLISWHERYYLSKPALAKKYLELGSDGSPRLKTSERKKILLNNIHGVDIDAQAVEVTKLSLLLKVLENQAQLEFAVGHVLPNLSKNIVCGNTLIDEGGGLNTELSIFRPFGENAFFPEVLAAGGFDAVVGNPPYLNVDTVWGANDPRLKHLKSRYPHVHTDKTDLLFYFLARSVEICKGEIGLIVSRSFLEADKAQKLRGWLASNIKVRKVIDMRHTLVFPRVGINTALVFLTKSMSAKTASFIRHQAAELPPGYTAEYFEKKKQFETLVVASEQLGGSNWNFGSKTTTSFLDKIDAAGTPLGDIFHVGQGMQMGANKAFRFSHKDISVMTDLAEKGFLRERARNSDIKPFKIGRSDVWMIYPYAAESFKELPDPLQQHLLGFKAELEQRAAFIRGDCEWWKYTFPLHLEHFYKKKIVSPYMSRSNAFAIDTSAQFFFSTDTTVLYGDLEEDRLKFLLGVLNTELLSARFRFHSKLKGGRQYEYFAKQISRLIVPEVDSTEEFFELVVSRVSEITQLEEAMDSTLVKAEKKDISKNLVSLKNEINEGLRDFVGLSKEEARSLQNSLD